MWHVRIGTLFLITLLAACDRPPTPKNPPPDHNALVNSNVKQDPLENSPNAAEAPYELQFIDTMIAYDEHEIDAAHLVATRTGHQELKLFAKSMIAERQQEIDKMRALRPAWFGSAGPAVNLDLPGVREGVRSIDLEKLDTLKENLFDQEFLRQILPFEQGSLALLRDLLTKDVHPELKQLAQSVIEDREADIQRMQGWQKQWVK